MTDVSFKVGQRVRLKPPPSGCLLEPLAHLVGVVQALEPDHWATVFDNGLKNVAVNMPISHANRGAYVAFGNEPGRYRVPLEALVPA